MRKTFLPKEMTTKGSMSKVSRVASFHRGKSEAACTSKKLLLRRAVQSYLDDTKKHRRPGLTKHRRRRCC